MSATGASLSSWGGGRRLSAGARAQLLVVVAAAAACTALSPGHAPVRLSALLVAVLIAIGVWVASTADLVPTSGRRVDSWGLVLAATALLLPPLVSAGVTALVVSSWAVRRRPLSWVSHAYAWAALQLAAVAGAASWRQLHPALVLSGGRGWRLAVAGLVVAAVVSVVTALLSSPLVWRVGSTTRRRDAGVATAHALLHGFAGGTLAVAAVVLAVAAPPLLVLLAAPAVLIRRYRHSAVPTHEGGGDRMAAPGRHTLHATAAAELRRAERTGAPVSALMIELDQFHEVNNRYGHLVGEAVLTELAELIRDGLRGYDTAIRLSGERYAVLLPGSDIARATTTAERLRAAVADHWFTPLPPEVRLTASVGATQWTSGWTLDVLLAEAERWLAAARQAGHNRVQSAVTASAPPPFPRQRDTQTVVS